jgi:lipoate-protein ligase A
MTLWQVRFDAQPHGAQEQMRIDHAAGLAAQASVRIFLWDKPAVSLGFKQAPPAWLGESRWKHSGLEWVERPSAGGVAVHGSDVSLCVVLPRVFGISLRSAMAAVCRCAVKLCSSYGADAQALLEAPSSGSVTYCLAETSPYAVMLGGRKVAGFGARRYPNAWLVQGSLLVRPIPESLAVALPEPVLAGLDRRATDLARCAQTGALDERSAGERWASLWEHGWRESVEISCRSACNRE